MAADHKLELSCNGSSTMRIVGNQRIEWKGEAMRSRSPRYHEVPALYEIHVTPGAVDIRSVDGRPATKLSDIEALLAVEAMASDLSEQVLGLVGETDAGEGLSAEQGILDKADAKIAALSPSGTLTPDVAESFVALVEKAEQQLRDFDFSDRTVEQDALLDRLLGPGVKTPYGIPRWVVPIAPESSAEQDAHAHLAHMASAPNRGAVIDDQVPMPVMPTERLPVCARCTTPVERMRRLDNIATGDMRIDLTCHGETREVRFTRAELNATGKISTMIYDRLAAAWEPSA